MIGLLCLYQPCCFPMQLNLPEMGRALDFFRPNVLFFFFFFWLHQVLAHGVFNYSISGSGFVTYVQSTVFTTGPSGKSPSCTLNTKSMETENLGPQILLTQACSLKDMGS